MRSIWIFLFSLVMALIVMSFSFFKSDYSDIASGIRNKVGKNLAKKHKMDFIGTSSGMMDCVRMVGFSFEINRPVSRDEARYLIVDCVEELLKAFNENEKIRPFLPHSRDLFYGIPYISFVNGPKQDNIFFVHLFKLDTISNVVSLI